MSNGSAFILVFVITVGLWAWLNYRYLPPVYVENLIAASTQIDQMDELRVLFLSDGRADQVIVSPDGRVRAVAQSTYELAELDPPVEIRLRVAMNDAGVTRITRIDGEVEFLMDATTRSNTVFLSGIVYSPILEDALSLGLENQCSILLFLKSSSGQCASRIDGLWHTSYRWFSF